MSLSIVDIRLLWKMQKIMRNARRTVEVAFNFDLDICFVYMTKWLQNTIMTIILMLYSALLDDWQSSVQLTL